MARETTRAGILLAAVFAVGLAAGWLGNGAYAQRHHHHTAHADERLLERMSKELRLTPVQQDSVRAIFDRHRKEIHALWQETHPRYDAIRAAARSEIRAQLTPEQCVREEELAKEWDRERESHERN